MIFVTITRQYRKRPTNRDDRIPAGDSDALSAEGIILYGVGVQVFMENGPLSIDWTARIEKITQLDRTFVRIQRV